MPWKRDEDGALVVGDDGNPVMVGEDGDESPFDPDRYMANAKAKRDELKAMREKLDALSSKESVDPEAHKALKQEIEALKKGKGKADLESQLADLNEKVEALKGEVADRDEKLKAKEAEVFERDLSGKFSRSKFFVPSNGDKALTVLTPRVAERYYGGQFKTVDGKMVALDKSGNVIRSKKADSLGEPASFDEAIQILIENDPDKDTILRSSGASGSGADGGDNPSDGATGGSVSRETWDKMPPEKQSEHTASGGTVHD